MVVAVVAAVATVGALAAMVALEDPSIERDSASKKKERCDRRNQGLQPQTLEMHSKCLQCQATQGSRRPSALSSRRSSSCRSSLSAAFAAALAKSQDYEARIFNHLKKHFKNKVELATAELRQIAGGSPNGDGERWLTERAPVMWSDWHDLCEQHKVTLKRFKVSDLVRIIKSRPFPSSGLLTQSAPQSYCTTTKLVLLPRCAAAQ